jgi:hypothetical protein
MQVRENNHTQRSLSLTQEFPSPPTLFLLCLSVSFHHHYQVTVWLELVGSLVVLSCSMLAVWSSRQQGTGALSPSMAGLALSYAVQVLCIDY